MFKKQPNVNHKMKRKFLGLPVKTTLSCLFFLCAVNTHAQQNGESEKAEQKTEDVERIIVSGQNLDAAMSAFRSGNFELAEIEFKKNAKCALRIERNKRALVDGMQTSALNNATQSSASLGGSSQLDNNSPIPAPSVSSGIGGKASNREKDQTVRSRTCTDRGYQLYMTALSQIQLGRNEEAEKNLKTASFLNKNIYDAHYRIGLMQLLRNDKDTAQDRLEKIQDVLDRCRDCEAKEEIVARIDFLEKALSGKIKLR